MEMKAMMSSKIKLDKLGIIILSISIIVCLVFVIPGIVLLAGNNGSKNNYSNYTSVYDGSLYREMVDSTAEYEHLRYYNNSNSGIKNIELNNCIIYSIKDSKERTVDYSGSGYNDGKSSFYAKSGETYYIVLKSTGGGMIEFLIKSY